MKMIIYAHNDEDIYKLSTYLHYIGIKWQTEIFIMNDGEMTIDCNRAESKSIAFCVKNNRVSYMNDGGSFGGDVYNFFKRQPYECYDHYEYIEFDKEFGVDMVLESIKMGLL